MFHWWNRWWKTLRGSTLRKTKRVAPLTLLSTVSIFPLLQVVQMFMLPLGKISFCNLFQVVVSLTGNFGSIGFLLNFQCFRGMKALEGLFWLLKMGRSCLRTHWMLGWMLFSDDFFLRYGYSYQIALQKSVESNLLGNALKMHLIVRMWLQVELFLWWYFMQIRKQLYSAINAWSSKIEHEYISI